MATNTVWKCPFCDTNTFIATDNRTLTTTLLNRKSRHGNMAIAIESISCANDECRELTVTVKYGNATPSRAPNNDVRYILQSHHVKIEHSLLSETKMMAVPDDVPEEIAITYREAAQLASISGRASAAMSRRCLQGMVRDFFAIPHGKRGKLGAELSYAKDAIDPDLWDAIHAVRSVGDIGAHMDNNVDHIIDISSNEAILLVGLIETLFKEWYQARAKKKRSTAALLDLVGTKRQQQKEAKALTKLAIEATAMPASPDSTDA